MNQSLATGKTKTESPQTEGAHVPFSGNSTGLFNACSQQLQDASEPNHTAYLSDQLGLDFLGH